MRLIDADAMKRYIDCGHLRSPTEKCFSELDVVHMLDKRPTIDAVPVVHAEWIPSSVDPADPYFRCSNCRHGRDSIYFQGDEYNFCPHCGAKMDGEAE